MIRKMLALAALAVALSGCVGATGTEVDPTRYAATAPVSVDPATAAAMVSAIRARHGLGPVTVDPELNRLAQQQADAMAAAGEMSHTVLAPFGRRMGGRFAAAAENLGAGYQSMAEGMVAWETSPSHLANMLHPELTHIGIASAFAPQSPYRNFFAMILAAPRS